MSGGGGRWRLCQRGESRVGGSFAFGFSDFEALHCMECLGVFVDFCCT